MPRSPVANSNVPVATVTLVYHVLVPSLPAEPVAGASLAISGLLGAYSALAWNDRVRFIRHRYILVVVELAAVVSMVVWTLVRNIPEERNRET